jgi:hypothetical protein
VPAARVGQGDAMREDQDIEGTIRFLARMLIEQGGRLDALESALFGVLQSNDLSEPAKEKVRQQVAQTRAMRERGGMDDVYMASFDMAREHVLTALQGLPVDSRALRSFERGH